MRPARTVVHATKLDTSRMDASKMDASEIGWVRMFGELAHSHPRPRVWSSALASSPLLISTRHHHSIMDKATDVLARGVPPGVIKSFRALADHGDVPLTILQHRERGRPSINEKTQRQRLQ
ncbi:hypothetical protein F5883DRAFT_562006 [Diaporthe sp. PMI_573]|nr:hypothetical protein F5883DRAFT_562006 [Diaporthaceae sp. PMI_573]